LKGLVVLFNKVHAFTAVEHSKTIAEQHKISYYDEYELSPCYWELGEVFNTHGLPIEMP
jgi:hypothetical protein